MCRSIRATFSVSSPLARQIVAVSMLVADASVSAQVTVGVVVQKVAPGSEAARAG
jgi:hypothetical protein